MYSTLPISQTLAAQNIAKLPHYNTNELHDLPSDAAPEGVLADGGVYYDTYKMLTPSDLSLLQSITGKSSFEGDPPAIAIGTDRADAPIGWAGGLTGDVSASYLGLIEAAESDPPSNGTYDGYQISSSELNAALGYLNGNAKDSGSTRSVSVSA